MVQLLAVVQQAEKLARRPLSLRKAIVAFFAVALVCCFNVVFVGYGCQPQEPPPLVGRHSVAGAICRWIDPTWDQKNFLGVPALVSPPSGFEQFLRGASLFLTPIVLVVLAIALTWRRRDIRFFNRGLLVAALLAIGLSVVFGVSSS